MDGWMDGWIKSSWGWEFGPSTERRRRRWAPFSAALAWLRGHGGDGFGQTTSSQQHVQDTSHCLIIIIIAILMSTHVSLSYG